MSENFLALDGVSGGDGPRNPQRLLAKIGARGPPVALADRGQAVRLGVGPGAGGPQDGPAPGCKFIGG